MLSGHGFTVWPNCVWTLDCLARAQGGNGGLRLLGVRDAVEEGSLLQVGLGISVVLLRACTRTCIYVQHTHGHLTIGTSPQSHAESSPRRAAHLTRG